MYDRDGDSGVSEKDEKTSVPLIMMLTAVELVAFMAETQHRWKGDLCPL